MTTPPLHTLDDILSAGQPDGIALEPVDSFNSGYRDLTAGDSDLHQRVTVRLVIDRYASVLTFSLRSQGGSLSCDQAKTLHKLLGYANQVADSYNERLREEHEERRKLARQREAEYEKEREERREERRQEQQRVQAALLERSEILLNELVEESGRIRLKGMKRWRPVTVEVADGDPIGDGDYTPRFRYRYAKHGVWEYLHGDVMAFHVKLNGKFYSVWDEGLEDLREWDQDGVAKEAKPYSEADQGGEAF